VPSVSADTRSPLRPSCRYSIVNRPSSCPRNNISKTQRRLPDIRVLLEFHLEEIPHESLAHPDAHRVRALSERLDEAYRIMILDITIHFVVRPLGSGDTESFLSSLDHGHVDERISLTQ
jgi:hypothetical protein